MLSALAAAGIDMADVAPTLEDEGVHSFAKSFDELLQALTDKANSSRLSATRQRARAAHMKIGMVGLGKMGANMTERLLEGGHQVVAFDLSAEARTAVAAKGAEPAASLDEMAAKLTRPGRPG